MTIGVFIGVLIISIMFAFVAIDSMYRVKFWKVAGVFVIAILVSVILCIPVRFMALNSNYEYIQKYKSLKITYETSIKSESLTGLEKIQIVNEIADINSELAKKQYINTRWYGFEIPEEITELEPIKID